MVSEELRQLLSTVDGGRIVMELTEQTHVDDYPRARALEHLRHGRAPAIDDTVRVLQALPTYSSSLRTS